MRRYKMSATKKAYLAGLRKGKRIASRKGSRSGYRGRGKKRWY